MNGNFLFELVQMATGHRTALSRPLGPMEWDETFQSAIRQAIVGWLYPSVQDLPQEQRPPVKILLQWYALSERIRIENRRINRECVVAYQKWTSDGLRPCILKGQGIAILYPDPLLRQPGDIDIWLDGSRQQILDCIRKAIPNPVVCYHHVQYTEHGKVCQEIHFIPSWMNAPVHHKRLQRFFKDMAGKQISHPVVLPNEKHPVCVPTLSFNAIYILVHIFRHLLEEGVGLRQLADYYYCL